MFEAGLGGDGVVDFHDGVGEALDVHGGVHLLQVWSAPKVAQ